MSLAFVFPGQGSQSIGMLSELAGQYPEIKTTFEEASEILGFDLWQLTQQGPEEDLNNTVNTQPALLTAGVALWKLCSNQINLKPVLMAGHSLGEYTALVCANALSFPDAVRLVTDRGRYMQSAVPEGTGCMAAILGLDDDQVETLCENVKQDQVVAAANYNSPGQVVIAGHKTAVERAVEAAKKNGARRSVILPVSVPSHCELMKDAAEKLATRLNNITISTPAIPIVHNVNAKQGDNIESIVESLVTQLYKPVHWVGTIQYMHNEGVTCIVECGPGKVLSGLIKRIERGIETFPVSSPDLFQKALAIH